MFGVSLVYQACREKLLNIFRKFSGSKKCSCLVLLLNNTLFNTVVLQIHSIFNCLKNNLFYITNSFFYCICNLNLLGLRVLNKSFLKIYSLISPRDCYQINITLENLDMINANYYFFNKKTNDVLHRIDEPCETKPVRSILASVHQECDSKKYSHDENKFHKINFIFVKNNFIKKIILFKFEKNILRKKIFLIKFIKNIFLSIHKTKKNNSQNIFVDNKFIKKIFMIFKSVDNENNFETNQCQKNNFLKRFNDDYNSESFKNKINLIKFIVKIYFVSSNKLKKYFEIKLKLNKIFNIIFSKNRFLSNLQLLKNNNQYFLKNDYDDERIIRGGMYTKKS